MQKWKSQLAMKSKHLKSLKNNYMPLSHSQDFRDDKFKEIIIRTASDFIQIESNHQSLITVTNVMTSEDFQKCTIFVTVFPDHKVDAVLDFLKRKRRDFKEYVKSKVRLGKIPQFDFAFDQSEKIRRALTDNPEIE